MDFEVCKETMGKKKPWKEETMGKKNEDDIDDGERRQETAGKKKMWKLQIICI